MTPYTGTPTATQAPSPTPSPGVAPITNLPADSDPPNAATFAQAWKVLADFIAWLMAPFMKIGIALSIALMTWRNARLQTRFAVDHFGFPNGNIIQWDENWDDTALISVVTTGQTTGTRWTFITTGGGGGGGNFAEHVPQYVIATENFPVAGVTSITGGGRAEIVRSPHGQTAVFTDDITACMFWSFLLPATASTNCTFVMGFDAGNHHVDSMQDGAFMYKTPSDVNWQFNATSGGVGGPIDTGIAAGSGTLHRAAIVLVGANQSDDSVARALLFIDGVLKANIATNLPYTSGGAGAGLQLAPIFGIVTTATASAIELMIGPVRYRQSMFPGDTFI